MGTRKLKPRRMWANIYPEVTCCYPTRKDAKLHGDPRHHHPVAVIPLDDTETLVATAAAAHYRCEHEGKSGLLTNGDCMRAALEAIGVLPKSRKQGGRK